VVVVAVLMDQMDLVVLLRVGTEAQVAVQVMFPVLGPVGMETLLPQHHRKAIMEEVVVIMERQIMVVQVVEVQVL
jgi:hypothetical protein